MTIEIRDGVYFSRVIFQDTPSSNVMGALFRDEDGWRLVYRFRHFRDNKIHDSDDVKSWYTMIPKKPDITEKEALNFVTTMVQGLEQTALATFGVPCPVEVLIVESDRAERVMGIFQSHSSFSMRVENAPPENRRN